MPRISIFQQFSHTITTLAIIGQLALPFPAQASWFKDKIVKPAGKLITEPTKAAVSLPKATAIQTFRLTETAVTNPTNLRKIAGATKDAVEHTVVDGGRQTFEHTKETLTASRELGGNLLEDAAVTVKYTLKTSFSITNTVLNRVEIVDHVFVPLEWLGSKTLDPGARLIGVDPRAFYMIYHPITFTREVVDGTGQALIQTAAAGETIGRGIEDGNVGEICTGAAQTVSAAIDLALNPALLQVVYFAIPEFLWDLNREREPEIDKVYPYGEEPSTEADGHIVYYINGMMRSKAEAIDEAQALADKLDRCVGLIYNDSHDFAGGGAKAVYDRIAPLLGTFPQMDSTTAKLSYFLRHNGGEISIVSHSQGTMIVRNAILQASRKVRSLESRVRWVAAGMPLRSAEVVVHVEQLTVLENSGDWVTEGLGLNFLEHDKKGQWRSGHSFIDAYLPQILPTQLWN